MRASNRHVIPVSDLTRHRRSVGLMLIKAFLFCLTDNGPALDKLLPIVIVTVCTDDVCALISGRRIIAS